MPNDLRIRQVGRAKIEKDSALGFQRVTRKYAIEGPKASKIGLDGSLDGVALFREYGEPDEEFSDHYLINQQVEPGGSVDKAMLVRQFAQIRPTWYAQETAESGQLKKLSRKYVVLKNSNHVLSQLGTPELGYSTEAWSLHPKTGQNSPDEADNWDMLPSIVKATEPINVSYQDGDAVGTIPKTAKLSSENENTRVVFPRTVKVLSNSNGNVEVEVTGSAPWKLGEQTFDNTEGKAELDNKQSLDVDQEFVVLADPRSTGFSVDDPTTYDPLDLYTQGIESLDIGSTATIPSSSIKPVKANVPSVYSQTDDADVLYSLQNATRETHFIEDLAVLENRIPSYEEANNTQVGNLIWVRAACSVDTSNPGIDVWSVSWAGPVSSFWRVGSAGEKTINQPTIVAFDHLGLKTFKTTSSRGGGTAVFTYFTVQEQVPIQSASYTKNSGSVSMDVKIIGTDGSKATSTFRQSFKNAAMYKTVSGGGGVGGSTGVRMMWPTKYKIIGLQFGNSVDYQQVACYGSGCTGIDWLNEPHSDMTDRSWKFHWQAADDLELFNHPCFQGEPIQVAAGHITWDSTIWNIGITGTPTNFKVTPIFFHNTLKIWKIEVTYF